MDISGKKDRTTGMSIIPGKTKNDSIEELLMNVMRLNDV